MPKSVTLGKGLKSILFWSIISAAFIGPGTVTTASKAGATFQLNLLWALIFSIIATVLLQEAAARITIASGKSLGQIIGDQYVSSQRSTRVKLFLFLIVAIGCAAYQTGNILGAVSGLKLISDFSNTTLTLFIGAISFALLWLGNFKSIANLLGLIVALMGFAFFYIALKTDVEFSQIITNSFFPKIPQGSLLLIIGLVGTTIVPYNLFLASGISQGQSISEMRIGISIAVLIGGLISISIMIVGTQVTSDFSFKALAKVMSIGFGQFSAALVGFGLFAAGLSSSVTSPLASAVTAKSLFGIDSNEKNWSVNSNYFRLTWGLVLGIGIFFSLLGIQPIPAIILAQALNGILLPVIVIFLMLTLNNPKLLPKESLNSTISNILLLIVLLVTSFLGLNNLWKAILRIFPNLEISSNATFACLIVLASLIVLAVLRNVIIQKK